MRIEQDSWNIIMRVIRRYPESKAELIRSGDPSAYRKRLKREVNAVETVLEDLNDEEVKVISARFWTESHHSIPYEHIYSTNYSPRQMRRIVKRMMQRVGEELGEIRAETKKKKLKTQSRS